MLKIKNIYPKSYSLFFRLSTFLRLGSTGPLFSAYVLKSEKLNVNRMHIEFACRQSFTYYKKVCAGSDACYYVGGDTFPLPMILFAQRQKL